LRKAFHRFSQKEEGKEEEGVEEGEGEKEEESERREKKIILSFFLAKTPKFLKTAVFHRPKARARL